MGFNYAVTAMLVSFIGFFFAYWQARKILDVPLKSEKVKEIADAIRTGAMAFLKKQYQILFWYVVIVGIILYYFIGQLMALTFVLGCIFSATAGNVGMRIATQANSRTVMAVQKSMMHGLSIAFSSGTVMGMTVTSLGLFGVSMLYLIFNDPSIIYGFGFGASSIALFARVGGGIYTKGADVGADLVGKVEAGIPEDDPRNPAVVADLVGDNVGDCAGMAADIFESYEVTIVSSLILGLALASLTGSVKWIVFPLIVRGIGVLSSIIGTAFVKSRNNENPLHTINRGFYTSAAISVVLFAVIAQFYMHEWRAFGSVVIGVILAIVIDHVTGYFTDGAYAPVKKIAEQTKSGAATTILSGLSTGLESSVWSALVIALTIVGAIAIYSGFPPVYVLYGVSLTGIGMLTLTGNNVAMDSFGPISDNAGGIGEMAKIDPKGQAILARLDAAGNTTKAITKGVAIGSAVIAAVSLFGSFITDVEKVRPGTLSNGIRVSEPLVFVGLLIGGALPLLFSSRLIDAVSRAASAIIADVRRQFRIPGILEGTVKPDYATTVAICTKSAQKELLPIALLAVLSSVLVGLLFGVEPLGGFLAGLILSGQLFAVFMSNAGGAWDNAKKYVEEGNFGGKGSEAHKASVVGDTVGDPLKDTAGPALNPLLKVINLISVIIAPLLVVDINPVVKYGLAAVILATLAWLLFFQKSDSKKAAFAQE